MCGIQRKNPARIDALSAENDSTKNHPLSNVLGTTTINFVMGNSKKKEPRRRAKRKKMSKRTGRHICSVRVVVSTRRRRSRAERVLLFTVASRGRRSAATGLRSSEMPVLSRLLRPRTLWNHPLVRFATKSRSSTWSRSSGARRRRPSLKPKLTCANNRNLRIGKR